MAELGSDIGRSSATGTHEYGDITPRIGAYAAAKMLAHAEPLLVLEKFAQVKPIPKNKSGTIKFRRPKPFPLATTPLTEGTSPTAQRMEYEDVSVSLAQYGAFNEITDVVHDTYEDPVLQDIVMLLGEQAAETRESLLWGVLKAGTYVYYGDAADSARTDVNDAISLNRQRAITRGLKAQRARKITSILGPSVNISTKPVEASFVAFAHTDLEADIRGLAGFTPVAEYGSRQPLCAEEIGSVEDVRYILSPVLTPIVDSGSTTLNGMVSTGGANVDVYPVVYFGKEAYGVTPLKGKESLKPMVLNPNQPRGGDPLGQKGTAGWKTYWAGLILNQSWIARLEVGVTDL